MTKPSSKITGAAEALREAAKQLRLNDDWGHAALCDAHAAELESIGQEDTASQGSDGSDELPAAMPWGPAYW